MKEQEIKPGDKIFIKGDLVKHLIRIGMDLKEANQLAKRYACGYAKAVAIWEDKDTEQKYVSIALCVEIPIEACEKREC